MQQHVLATRKVLALFGYRMRTFSARNVSQLSNTDLERSLLHMTLDDLNRVMYRCHQEEADDGHGFGAYNIPRYGDMVYCGLQGIVIFVLMSINFAVFVIF